MFFFLSLTIAQLKSIKAKSNLFFATSSTLNTEGKKIKNKCFVYLKQDRFADE